MAPELTGPPLAQPLTWTDLVLGIFWLVVAVLLVVGNAVGWPLLLYALRKERDHRDANPEPVRDWDAMFGGAYDYEVDADNEPDQRDQTIFNADTGEWEDRLPLHYEV